MAKKTAVKREIISVHKKYELMLILNPDLRESEISKKLKELVGIMEKAGGKILEEDIWGKKKFAYKIKKYHDGYYVVYNLELPSVFMKELRELLRIEKEVLRSMIISVPDDYVYIRYNLEGMAEDSKKAKGTGAQKTKAEPKKEVEKVKSTEAEKPVSEDEDAPKKEPKKSEEPKSDLDKKLDAILDGDDLKF